MGSIGHLCHYSVGICELICKEWHTHDGLPMVDCLHNTEINISPLGILQLQTFMQTISEVSNWHICFIPLDHN